MPFTLFLTLLPAWFAALVGIQADEVRTLVVEREVIMRVPVRPMPDRVDWEEKKGPKCIPSGSIRAAMVSNREHVDFLLFDRTRLRARLSDDCPALDFYKNFYLQPDDDYVCAKRETIRSRAGGSCRIEKFKLLVPQYKQVKR